MKPKTNKNILIIFTLLLFVVNSAVLYSAFWELKPGAKAGGMGFAYSALVKNSESVFYNPANLVYTEKPNIFLEYSKLYYGLDFDSLGYKSIFYSIPETDIGSFGAGFSSFDGNFYSESTYFLSYSKSFLSGGSRYSAGVTFKYLKKNINRNYSSDISNDPFFDQFGTALSNFTFDLGLSYRTNAGFINSFVVKNITKPNMAYQSEITESLPMIGTYGIAKRYNILFPTYFSAELEFIDTSIGKDINQIWYAFGIESELKTDNLFTRFGFNKNEISAGLSYSNINYNKSNFSFDYSISIPFSFINESLPMSLSTHRFGFNVSFGTFLQKPDINDSRWSKKIPKSYKLKNNSSNMAAKEIVLWVKDRAGNISNSISEVIIDKIKPTLEQDTEIRIIDDNKFYLFIYTEDANYYRYNNSSEWSDWKALSDDTNDFKNIVKGYDNKKINYVTYQIKDKAGNTLEDNFIIYNGEKSTDYNKYPVVDDIILKNVASKYETDKFNSNIISVEVVSRNESFDDLLLRSDIVSEEMRIVSSVESRIADKTYLVDISNLSIDGVYTLFFKTKKNGLLSNVIKKVIYIDNVKPKCYFKFLGKKSDRGFYGSKILPNLTTYQSFDTREWLLTADTTSSVAVENWTKIKPSNFNFQEIKEHIDSKSSHDLANNIKRYQLFLKVKDEAGNESIWHDNFYNFDERVPQIEDFSLNGKFKNNRYIIYSNKIEPVISLKSTDYLEFIFDDKSTKRFEVVNDTVNFNSSLTIPTELKIGNIIVRAYNNENLFDEKIIQYIVNINKPIISEFKIFDKITGSKIITNNLNIGMYIHGVNIDQVQISDNINFENSTYKSFNSPLTDYNLFNKEGLQYVFVRVKNGEEISSDTYSAVIKLDRVMPTLEYSITTLENNIVNLATVEIIYDKKTVSKDVAGYYFTEILEDIPSINSTKWEKEKISFYTFKSDKDEVKEIYLYLKDDAGNLSSPLKQVVILKKFNNNIVDDKENIDNNNNKNGSDQFIFKLYDFETGSNKVTDKDSIGVVIGDFEDKYSAWILSEADISNEIKTKSDKWLTKKPYKFNFSSQTPENTISDKKIFLYLRDNDGMIKRSEIKSSIRVDKFVTFLGNVVPESGSNILINNSKIEFMFNKLLRKTNGADELVVFCSGTKSGFHNSKISVSNKKIILNLLGQFSQNETIYLWVIGNYYDINMKKNYIFKKLKYQVEGELLKSELKVCGISNKIYGFSNEYIIEGRLDGFTDLEDNFTSYIFAPETKFTSTDRKRFTNDDSDNNNNNKTMTYELSELAEGEEILFKAQYFSNSGEKSEIFEAKILIDIIKAESRLYLFSENGSNVGFSNDLNLKIEVKADEDTREFLLEEIDE